MKSGQVNGNGSGEKRHRRGEDKLAEGALPERGGDRALGKDK